MKILNLNLIKDNNFLKLFFARNISIFGDSIDDVAFVLMIYKLTGSSLMMGIVMSVKIIVSFCSIFFGVLADKIQKNVLIQIGEYGQGIVLILVSVLYMNNNLSVNILLIAVVIQAFLGSISLPAKNSIIPYIVDRKMLLDANSILSVSQNIIQIIGFSVSAIFIEFTSISTVILIDSMTFIISGILYKFIKVENSNGNKNIITFKGYNKDLKEGFSFLINNKVIMIIILLSALANFSISPINVILPNYFSDFVNFKTYGYGAFQTMITVGAILGATILVYISNLFGEYWVFSFGFCISGISMLVLYSSKNLGLILLAAFVIGISISIVSTMTTTILQQIIPREVLGRVGSIFKLTIYISMPLGNITSGYLNTLINSEIIFGLYGMFMIFTFVFSITSNILKDNIKNNNWREKNYEY